MIYQADNGGGNTAKVPIGGVITVNSTAQSMIEAIANPITFYYGNWSAVINQAGHSKDLYNYYWTSYSRGTDGIEGKPQWHNDYLDGYIPLRVKSIYDPCPYLYRVASNGSWNQFASNPGWTIFSYLGGMSCNLNTLGESWFSALGRRQAGSSYFEYTGRNGNYSSSTAGSQLNGYAFGFDADKWIAVNHNIYVRSYGLFVRCIESPKLDNHERIF